jgi:hypothetical protein
MFIEENCVVIPGLPVVQVGGMTVGPTVRFELGDFGCPERWRFFNSTNDDYDYCEARELGAGYSVETDEDDVLIITVGEKMLEVSKNDDGEWDFTARVLNDGDYDHCYNYDNELFFSNLDPIEDVIASLEH